MKGIVRISGIDFYNRKYTYWSLLVKNEVVKRLKREIQGLVESFHTFYTYSSGKGVDRSRVDYVLVSCNEKDWERSKEVLERRYACLGKEVKLRKRNQSMCMTDVTFYRLQDLIPDFSISINIMGEDPDLMFPYKVTISSPPDSFYHPYISFIIESKEYSNLCIQVERQYWKEKKWLKRQGWRAKNGNYKGDS